MKRYLLNFYRVQLIKKDYCMIWTLVSIFIPLFIFGVYAWGVWCSEVWFARVIQHEKNTVKWIVNDKGREEDIK